METPLLGLASLSSYLSQVALTNQQSPSQREFVSPVAVKKSGNAGRRAPFLRRRPSVPGNRIGASSSSAAPQAQARDCRASGLTHGIEE